MKILVDADSCPRDAREILLRFSLRLGIKIIFAANRQIPGIPAKPAINAQMDICPQEEGAADRHILELAAAGDLVLTRDLPLAEQLVNRGIVVLDDRGRVFSKENIRTLRSIRDFVVGLAENGLGSERSGLYGKKELKALSNSLDRELTKLLRK